MKTQNIVILVLVLLVVGGGAYFLSMQNKQGAGSEVMVEEETVTAEDSTEGSMTNEEVNIIEVDGSNFKFDPSTITVKKGQKNKIVFKNIQGMHDFKVDELGIATHVIKEGEEESVEFTADEVGTFEFYCSVGQHRAMGMKGTLIVE